MGGNTCSVHISLGEQSGRKGTRIMSGPGPGTGEAFLSLPLGNGCRDNDLFAPDTGTIISIKLGNNFILKKPKTVYSVPGQMEVFFFSCAVIPGRQGKSAGFLKFL